MRNKLGRKKYLRICLCAAVIGLCTLCLFACKSSEVATESDATSTTVATVPDVTTVTEPVATSTPTPVPTATPTPTPSPIPTPVPEYVEPQFETTWYNGFVDPRSVRAEIVTNPYDIDCLVNKYYALPEDFKPDDLVSAPHSFDQQLRTECNDAWVKMYDDCYEATGQGLLLVSGWRDWGTSTFLFNRSVNLRGTAFACAKNAWPGRSEHQLGLAIDITPAWADNILDEFGETVTGIWVDEHCYEYGFVRRYQPQYVNETGYGIEAWHYRYVGVELATYLYENDMTLEAYHGKVQVMPGDEE